VNTLVAVLAFLVRRWLIVAGLAVGVVASMVTTAIDTYVGCQLSIPLVPAAGIAALLVTLGFVLGRSGRAATPRRHLVPRPTLPAVAATSAARIEAHSAPLPLPSYSVLPAVREDGRDTV
jgi:hypothetical protein